MINNYKNKTNTLNLFTRLSYNNIIKRFMMSMSKLTRLVGLNNVPPTNSISLAKRPSILLEQQRNYPGQYRAVRPKKFLTDDEKRRLNLTKHETTHENIQHVESGKIEGLFTSAQNKDGTSPVTFDKIAPIKINGSFIPVKDPLTKKPLLDSNGNTIPDPDKGGQWMATYPNQRIIAKDAQDLYDINNQAQSYIDQYENIIGANIKKNRNDYGPRVPKQIGGQDDEI